MLETLKKLSLLLTPYEKKQGLFVLAMIICMAVIETIGVASIIPFLTVLGSPEVVTTNRFLNSLYSFIGFQSTSGFLFFLGCCACLFVFLSAVMKTVTVYSVNRFTHMRQHSFSKRLLETYLQQPYSFFLNRHTGEMTKGILSEVTHLVNDVLRPAADAVAYSILTLMIVGLLIAHDTILALIVGLVIGGSYLLIYLIVQGKLKGNGRKRSDTNRERFTAAAEVLAGIKEIKLLGCEQIYLSRFASASKMFAKYVAINASYSQIPKYFIEAVAFGGIIVLSLVMMERESFGAVLPVLGVYAFAGYKLLPAVQIVYSSLTKLRFGSAAVDDIYDDLKKYTQFGHENVIEKVVPKHSIDLVNVTYRYSEDSSPAIDNINLTIPMGARVGIVGGTGAGKTTLVDILLGLLRPSSGALKVDGRVIDDLNLRDWQASLGYVPQDIFLLDSSINENVALGNKLADIDLEKVKVCCKAAQASEFIEEQLPQTYMTTVGDRGVRLSGGQKQRIGIARALYRNPDVLILDEATSALDNMTEKLVMESIKRSFGKKTIIIIAHRLTTVTDCDFILVLDGGKLTDIGTYDDLVQRSDRFKQMVYA
jgi:ABC-type multidrug transport system fused ATPase/permease subunit